MNKLAPDCDWKSGRVQMAERNRPERWRYADLMRDVRLASGVVTGILICTLVVSTGTASPQATRSPVQSQETAKLPPLNFHQRQQTSRRMDKPRHQTDTAKPARLGKAGDRPSQSSRRVPDPNVAPANHISGARSPNHRREDKIGELRRLQRTAIAIEPGPSGIGSPRPGAQNQVRVIYCDRPNSAWPMGRSPGRTRPSGGYGSFASVPQLAPLRSANHERSAHHEGPANHGDAAESPASTPASTRALMPDRLPTKTVTNEVSLLTQENDPQTKSSGVAPMADNSVVPAQHVTEYDSHEMPAVSSFSTDIPVRMSYSDYFRTMPRSEKHRYSSTVGASFQGRLTGPRPGMSATEMVIFQSEQMAEMDRIISELRQENKRLRSELGLTIRSLNQTSFALRETEAQLESANQMNENLQRKFVELTGTFRESETEIQAMLHQLRRYIQTELEVGTNAPHSRNGYRPNGMQPVDGSRSGLMGTEDNGPLRLLSPRDGRGAGVPGPVPGTEVLPEPRQ